MEREIYDSIRSGYRKLRRDDLNWRANPYAARNKVETPPNAAGEFVRSLNLSPRVIETLRGGWDGHSRGQHRLSITSPRIKAVLSARHVASGLDLPRRVALRRARRQIEALEAQRAKVAPGFDLVRFANGLLAGNQAEIAAALGGAA